MKNYTFVLTVLGALAISPAVLGASVSMNETQQPVSQKQPVVRYVEREPQAVRYVEREPGDIVYTEQSEQMPRYEREWRRVVPRGDGYRYVRRSHWNDTDVDYPDTYSYDGDHYYHHGEGLRGLLPWNW